MKYLKYVLIAGIAFLSLSSNKSGTSSVSEGIYPGDLFPDIKNLENISGKKLNLLDFKGQKVLINFWAAYDANSRMNNVLFSNIIENKDYPVKMISISFDKSKSVFERTLTMDKIDSEYQFLVDNENSPNLFKEFRLEKGFKNYLVNEDGVIIAKNLEPKELSRLMNEN